MSIVQGAPEHSVVRMNEFQRYLHQFRCEKGVVITHTSMKGGKYHIPEGSMDAFFEQYEHAMVKGADLYLTEKPLDPSKFRTDLDFRFPMPEELRRVYTMEHLQRIVTAYSQVLTEYLRLPNEKCVAYVMEKTGPSEYRGKLKDGIHIVWPHIITPNSFMHLVRKKILDKAPEVFQGLPLCNPFEDVIDHQIIDKVNWQMYGSKKPEGEAYRVTHVFEYDHQTQALTELPPPTAKDELTFPRLFAMRDYRNTTVAEVRSDKMGEVDEYVKHVLPTMDDRRKNKLHTQIFGNAKNLTKNYISEDELVLARQLVSECIAPMRAESYEDWIKLGWTLRNIDYRLLEAWVEFSRVSSKYVEGECQRLWNNMRIDTLGMATLIWWARNDNPIKYQEIIDTSIVGLIDRCIGSDGAHFDVARVVHAMYKDEYRFTTKDVWFMFKKEKHRWVRTREGLQLRMVLSQKVCMKFMERSMYWSTEAGKHNGDAQGEIFTDKSKKLNKIAMQLKTAGYKDSVMKECKALFTDEQFEELLDSHPHLVGFENGVYDLRMHEFREGLPDDYISYSTGRYYIDYNPESVEAKEIQTYLSQVFTNPNVRKYMMDLLSSTIDGGMRQEKFYIFTGSGSNSKSAILNLVQKAIGDYYCILPIALLTQKRTASNNAQSELERTKGRRLAVMQEPGENEKLNIGLMKELSGGDRILVRGLFKEPIEFRPQFKMVMTCNELPEVPSDDGGTWRRLRVVEYTSKFCDNPNPGNPKEFPLDPDLLEKFDRWSDTFISMIIAHHQNLDAKNMVEPMEVTVATHSYRQNNDVIGQYITERFVKDETSTDRVPLNKTYMDFKAWAYQVVQKGKKIPDRTQFRAYVEGKFGAYPADGKGWRGIRYLQKNDDVDSDVE
jgi:P4 family phage/plasmid primase-like protien